MTPKEIKRYREDPLAFCREIIHFEPTEQQEQIINAINEPEAKIAIDTSSSHGIGMTAVNACLALWFISVFASSAVPIAYSTVAEKERMLREVKKWHSNMDDLFREDIIFTGEKYGAQVRNRAIEENIIQLRPVRKDNPDTFQGWCRDRLLFIADNAHEIPAIIFTVGLGASEGLDNRFLISGSLGNTDKYFNELLPEWLAEKKRGQNEM